jgi:hypothetical protein
MMWAAKAMLGTGTAAGEELRWEKTTEQGKCTGAAKAETGLRRRWKAAEVEM